MNKEDTFYFDLLKKEIVVTFLKNHSAVNAIEDWKGEDIILFQEDLFSRVKGKVSEKWFYSYFKNDPKKLPRVDMLNLLCEYVGQKNWNTFKSNHRFELGQQTPKIKKKLYFLFAAIPILGLIWFGYSAKNDFHFCFVDHLLNEPIVKVPLDIKILNDGESPIFLKTDSLGCFSYKTSEEYVKFIVKSPYHKTDTIVRFLEHSKNQNIQLATDDYALMLKYYTEGNVTDWSKHRKQLQNLIDDNAVIYQLRGNTIGVELFTKDDFISLLTIPTNGLKRVKVLDRTLKNGKIIKLKFIML